MRAGIAATAIIAFVFTWNDFLFSLLLTSVDTRTVPVAMTRVVGADVGVDWGVFAAIGTIYLLPVLLDRVLSPGAIAARRDVRHGAAIDHSPQRNAAVRTGASHSRIVSSSSAVTVIEQPAISSEVT